MALKVEAAEGEVILNTSPKRFAGTMVAEANPSGIVAIGMTTLDSQGVELRVPKGVGVGNHSTTIRWELVTGP